MRRDDLQRLQEHRSRMQHILDQAEREQRDLTTAEQNEFDEHQAAAEPLVLEYRRAQRGDVELAAAGFRPDGTRGSRTFRPLGEHEPSSYEEYRTRERGPLPQDSPEYRSRFWRWLSSPDEAVGVEDVVELRALSKASGAVGLYLTPTDFYRQVIRSLRFMGSVASLATTFETADGNTLQVPANTAHGVATWVAEAGAYGLSDETFAQVNVSAFKAGTSIQVSEELLQDSAFPLDSYLSNEFGERIGVLSETGFVQGTGSGQPQGLATAGGGVTVIQALPGNSTSFDYPSMMSLLYGVPPQYRPGSAWLMSDSCEKALRLLRDTQGNPLWQTSVAEGQPNTFCGYPTYVHPDLAAVGASNKSIVFGNFGKAYLIRRAGGFFMQKQSELYSANGLVGFRGYARLDGRVVLADALRIGQHSAT